MSKKYILLLFIFCLQLVPAKAQWVTIPDTNFVNKLTQLYPSCMNGNMMDTSCSGIVNAVNLSIFNSNINDISGIQYFKSLKLLHAPINMISSINELPDSLEILNLYNNQMVTLPQLPNTLKQLNVHQNSLTTLPALPIHLEMLNCSENLITMLPMLNDSIKYLSCGANQLGSLPQLPNGLYELECSGNLINNLPPLPDSLKTLDCSYNLLTSLPQLPENLEHLSCQYNQLTSIPNVPNSMYTFRVLNNNIICINNLPFVGSSSSGNISYNPLTCVPNQTNYSLGLPLCLENDPINNPNNCFGVANITGYVYKDIDTNCSYTNSDLNTSNIPVKVYDSQNNMLAVSYTVNGAYSFTLLQTDTFVVKIDDVALPFSMDCGQLNNQNVPLDSANQTIQNINFPVLCDTASDLKIYSVTRQGWVFPNQIHTLNTNITNTINWYNLNCSAGNYAGTVSINITGPVTYVEPANNAFTPIVNGNTFTYKITDFSTITPASFGLQFLTDTTAQANDQICVHVEIDPTPIDADTANNSYDFCYQVLNSYDPNMKEVYPVNVLPGYDDWFTYTIHFQNTGNAPAFNIRLRDTLDTNLDINTFEIRGYSHPAIVSIIGNILTVRFNNIMLPDSTSNYEGSMGYFQYRIKPIPNLPLGTQIENTAYIYFDYNAPIVTNTTQNNFQTVVSTINTTSVEQPFVLFPNPSTGIFMFNPDSYRDNKNIKTVEVFNMMGELVLSQGNAKQINLSGFTKGIYYARINGEVPIKLVKD